MECKVGPTASQRMAALRWVVNLVIGFYETLEISNNQEDMRAMVLCCSTNIRFGVLDHNRFISYSANREVNEPATYPDHGQKSI